MAGLGAVLVQRMMDDAARFAARSEPKPERGATMSPCPENARRSVDEQPCLPLAWTTPVWLGKALQWRIHVHLRWPSMP